MRVFEGSHRPPVRQSFMTDLKNSSEVIIELGAEGGSVTLYGKRKLKQVVTLAGSSNTSMYALSFSPSRFNVLDTLRGNNTDEMHEGPDLLAAHPVKSNGGGELMMGVQALRKNSPKAIAEMTGGEYKSFSTRDSFETHMLEFTNHLHSRYLLTFVPKDPHPGAHSIHVTLKKPANGKVLARGSYWSVGRKQ